MRYRSPHERRVRRRRAVVWAVVLVLIFLVVWLFDRMLFHALFAGDERLARMERKDWYRTFRVMGTLWPWIFICSAIFAAGASERLAVRGERLKGAGLLIFLSAGLAGLAAEVLQVVTGRLRPNGTDGATVFRGIFERFVNSDGLGFPSSHAAVAFGAAWMIWFYWRWPGVIALIGACLCSLTRLLAGAHFVTDVVGAALVGYAMARLLRPGSWAGLRTGRVY